MLKAESSESGEIGLSNVIAGDKWWKISTNWLKKHSSQKLDFLKILYQQ